MEKKKTTAKESVKEESVQEAPQKLTYEQLTEVANNLNQQCRQLYEALQNARKIIADFNEVKLVTDLLGKSEFFSDSFIETCARRVEEAVTRMFESADAKPEEAKA